MVFKFADFKYEKDNDYDCYPFMSTADMLGKPFRIILAKVMDKKDNSGKKYVKAVIEFEDGARFKTTMLGVVLVQTIENILNYYEGTIPAEVQDSFVKIEQTIVNGKPLNVFVDC